MTKLLGACSVVLFLAVAGCDMGAAPLSPQDDPAGQPQPGGAQAQGPSLYTGNVIVMVEPGGEDVIVALDVQDGRAPDGTADQVFRLQRSKPSRWGGTAGRSEPVADGRDGLHLRNATVRWDGRTVQIRHPSYNAVLALASNPVAAGSSGRTLTGYGLSRVGGEWPMTIGGLGEVAAIGFTCGGQRTSSASVAPAGGPLTDGEDEGECAAGGPGSDGCSLTVGAGCSVSCDPGYYACCNVLGGCKCRPDPGE